MSTQLAFSMFHDVLFPPDNIGSNDDQAADLHLNRLKRFLPAPAVRLTDIPLVVFDFETTGLDSEVDRIIEVGAIRVENGNITEEFHSLIKPDIALPQAATMITGITADMLDGQPAIEEILPDFIKFIEGAILVAHNADFDVSFLKSACLRQGIELEWPCFCTLKMARTLLPDLESRNLDSLAQYYGLTFESRHRSIGDVKVTSDVLKSFLNEEGKHLSEWQHLKPFQSV